MTFVAGINIQKKEFGILIAGISEKLVKFLSDLTYTSKVYSL